MLVFSLPDHPIVCSNYLKVAGPFRTIPTAVTYTISDGALAHYYSIPFLTASVRFWAKVILQLFRTFLSAGKPTIIIRGEAAVPILSSLSLLTASAISKVILLLSGIAFRTFLIAMSCKTTNSTLAVTGHFI